MEVPYLVKNKGIAVDDANIETIKDWSGPVEKYQLRIFLGLSGYYQCVVIHRYCQTGDQNNERKHVFRVKPTMSRSISTTQVKFDSTNNIEIS